MDQLLPDAAARCYAWALMGNHVHLLVQTERTSISQIMARLNTAYAVYFNRRHDRCGHLFQNRFKSRLVQSDADLMGLVRYIHRNPLDAGIVSSLDDLQRFSWCGHGALTGQLPPRRFHSVPDALALFGETPPGARRGLLHFMREQPVEDTPPVPARDRDDPTEPGPLGDARRPWTSDRALRTIDELIGSVARDHALAPTDLLGSSKRTVCVKARAILCYRAARDLGLSGEQIARHLRISPSAVSRALEKGRTARTAVSD